MDPAMLFGHLDPANNFAMGGLPMALARALLLEGKPLPKTLFLDVMVEKTKILIEHIKNHHLGLSLMANISENTAIIRMYDNFTTVNSQLLHITISNHSDLEINCGGYILRLMELYMTLCLTILMTCHH